MQGIEIDRWRYHTIVLFHANYTILLDHEVHREHEKLMIWKQNLHQHKRKEVSWYSIWCKWLYHKSFGELPLSVQCTACIFGPAKSWDFKRWKVYELKLYFYNIIFTWNLFILLILKLNATQNIDKNVKGPNWLKTTQISDYVS